MRLSDTGELSLLKKIRDDFSFMSKHVPAGIGDDAAALAPNEKILLLTTDVMAEDVHFDFGFVTPYQTGFKLVSANASDIYAMGGTPAYLLLNIAAGGDTDVDFIYRMLQGVEDSMLNYHMKLIGGDLSSSKSGIVLSAVAVGYAKKIIRRSGARPGDKIYVTGNLGDSAAGLGLLRKIGRSVSIETGRRITRPLRWSVMQPLLKRHLLPEAVNPGRMRYIATSMMDISDGLFIDLTRLCEESKVGARVYAGSVPISKELKTAASFLGEDPFRLAAAGGEDYQLIFTARPDKKVAYPCIGEITESGLTVIRQNNREEAVRPDGYRHWR